MIENDKIQEERYKIQEKRYKIICFERLVGPGKSQRAKLQTNDLRFPAPFLGSLGTELGATHFVSVAAIVYGTLSRQVQLRPKCLEEGYV